MLHMNRVSGAIVFFLGVIILWEGRTLPIGTLNDTGSGFFPVILAVLLMIISLFLVIPKEKPTADESRSFSALAGGAWKRLTKVPVAILFSVFFFEYLGFLVTAFLLMAYLFFAVSSQKWHVAILGAAICTGVTYLLFVILMKSNLPQGMLGF